MQHFLSYKLRNNANVTSHSLSKYNQFLGHTLKDFRTLQGQRSEKSKYHVCLVQVYFHVIYLSSSPTPDFTPHFTLPYIHTWSSALINDHSSPCLNSFSSLFSPLFPKPICLVANPPASTAPLSFYS